MGNPDLKKLLNGETIFAKDAVVSIPVEIFRPDGKEGEKWAITK